MILSIHSCTCWLFVCLIWLNAYLVPLPILDFVILFYCYWVVYLPNTFWILVPCWIYGLQILSWFSRFPFHLVFSFAMQGKTLFYIVSFIFVFVPCAHTVISTKIIEKTNIKEVSPMFSSSIFTVSGVMFKSLIHF